MVTCAEQAASFNPDLTYRQIFLDVRALESAPSPAWMGYSIGRGDGDTLVVESNGYTTAPGSITMGIRIPSSCA
jgi:hypothetical protein